jgi:hypothetical protein
MEESERGEAVSMLNKESYQANKRWSYSLKIGYIETYDIFTCFCRVLVQLFIVDV